MNHAQNELMLNTFLKETGCWLFDEDVEGLRVDNINLLDDGYEVEYAYGDAYNYFETINVTHLDLQTWLFEKVIKFGNNL